MGYATVNGSEVIEARVSIPRVGLWHADVTIDKADPLAGSATLDLNGFTLKGTVLRGAPFLDAGVYRLVGGGGGLGGALKPRGYRSVPFSTVVGDVLQALGERAAGTSDRATMGKQLPFWTVPACRGGEALMMLAEWAACSWRSLPDGTLWFGPETWPGSALKEYELLRVDPLVDTFTLYAETPNLVPGTMLEGRKVSYVEHTIHPDRIRTGVWLE